MHVLRGGGGIVKCPSEIDRKDSLSFRIVRKKTKLSRLTRFYRYLARIKVRNNFKCEI